MESVESVESVESGESRIVACRAAPCTGSVRSVCVHVPVSRSRSFLHPHSQALSVVVQACHACDHHSAVGYGSPCAHARSRRRRTPALLLAGFNTNGILVLPCLAGLALGVYELVRGEILH